MSNVHKLAVPPRSRHGGRRNLKWSIVYNPLTGKHDWRVEYQPSVQVFNGSSASHADAEKEIAQYLDTLPRTTSQ